MSLSLREKQSLYHSLAQLLRSGIPLTNALLSLAQSSSGRERRLIQQVSKAITNGKTLGESFAAQRPDLSELEVGIVFACEKSGRLEYGLTMLSGYFGSLAAARERVLAKCAYPVFMLHLSVLMLNVSKLLTEGMNPYLRQAGGTLGLFWALVLVALLLFPLLRDAGAGGPGLDSFLRNIPVIGKIRSSFSTSRFCAVYAMQLDAGINVIDALEAAQRASLSGMIKQAVRNAIPEIRNGSQVGPLLAASRAFPEPVIRAILVGEQTGELDEELTRMTKEYQEKGVARLETVADWLPKLLYIGICLYVGVQMVGIIMTMYGPKSLLHELLQ